MPWKVDEVTAFKNLRSLFMDCNCRNSVMCFFEINLPTTWYFLYFVSIYYQYRITKDDIPSRSNRTWI